MNKSIKLSFTLLLSLSLIGCGKGGNGISTSIDNREYVFDTYTNVIMPTDSRGSEYKDEIADPSIVVGDDGRYYIFSTCRRAFVSDDMVNWKVLTTNIIDRPAYADGEKYGYPEAWAPDCIKIKDKWIYYYSLAAWDMPSAGIGYAVSDHVDGPYVDMGCLFNQDDIVMNGLIDPQPFIDDDGRVYMTVGSFHGNYLVELTDDGMGLLNGAKYQNEHKVLIAGVPLQEFNNTYYEGGYIIKKGKYYYYFASAGSCCEKQNSSYRVMVGRAENIAGPYLAPDGKKMTQPNANNTIGRLVIWGGTNSERRVSGPGHNSIFVDDAGDYWLIYHAYCDYDDFGTRHLFMDKLTWDENGFPYVTYDYQDENGKKVTVNCKPSYDREMDGPRFLKKETL